MNSNIFPKQTLANTQSRINIYTQTRDFVVEIKDFLVLEFKLTKINKKKTKKLLSELLTLRTKKTIRHLN